MKNRNITLLVSGTLFLLSACSGNHLHTPDQLPAKLANARPGDTLLIANGTYTDKEIRLTGKGTADKPIVIKAQDNGKVFVEGVSTLQLAGDYLVVEGLYFRNGHPGGKPVIEYRLENEVANNCRVTGCIIEYYNPQDRAIKNSWVALYGKNNRFDHNTLIGKQNGESTIIVQLNEERSQENNHSIDHNYFGYRPNYGSNGAETIRVGNSTYSLTSSQTKIIDNWFEHCNGEVEHVSIKSCDNLIARNVFYECAGELVLRHGNRNIVEDNVIIGNRKPHTGGIRVVNADQIIRNNYLEGLTGRRFYAALAVMNAVPNPLPNRYHQVENALIENNTFVRCDHIEFGVGGDFERTVPPTNTFIKNNLFYYPESTTVYEAHTDMSGVHFDGNKVVTANRNFATKGFIAASASDVPTYTFPVKKEECGALWYTEPAKAAPSNTPQTHVAESKQNSLIELAKKAAAGDIIVLQNNALYLIDETILIDKPLTLKSQYADQPLPIIRYNGQRGGKPMITITDHGVLNVEGIEFDGKPYEGNSRPMAGIAPAPKMQGTYAARVENCTFKHFEESSYAGFKALKNSFADTLYFENCRFHAISGEGISLAAEKEDDGKYSSENIIIKNCHFSKILGCAINIYRGGNDESTIGPTVYVENSTFESSSNQERGAAMRLIGAQTAHLNNLNFTDSGRGGAAIKFDECRWDDIRITNIRYQNSGKLRMNSLYCN